MVGVLISVLTTVPVSGQEPITITKRPWTGSVIVPSGQPIIPIFDGWYRNPDGTATLCFGYYSPNTAEDVTIPVGPKNFVEPAEYNGRQPDYFERIPEEPYTYRRRYCVFPVTVPADFGPDDRVVWYLQRGRGEVLSVPGKLVPAYVMDELRSPGRQNIAPRVRFSEDGPEAQGRNGMFVGPLTVAAGEPLDLRVWVDHPEEGVWVGWAKQQGPGSVTFTEQNTHVNPEDGTATTTARFSAPGEYLVRVQSIDDPVEAFEYHCCSTNLFIEVTVN
jgi:hypothetical protein